LVSTHSCGRGRSYVLDLRILHRHHRVATPAVAGARRTGYLCYTHRKGPHHPSRAESSHAFSHSPEK
jgi:hypothetical protein